MVEHLPHLPKVEGLSPAAVSSLLRVNSSRQMFADCTYPVMVAHWYNTHLVFPKVKSSSAATAASILRANSS